MTGYDAANPAARTPPTDPFDRDGDGVRPGPRPPRMDPPDPTGPVMGQPAGYSGYPTHRAPATSAFAAPPASISPSAPPTGSFGVFPAASPARPRRGLLGPITLVLVVLLLGVVAVQTVLIMGLQDDQDALRGDLAAQRTAAQEQNKGLEDRTKELERRAGDTLDAAAVANTVLPSVFRVKSLTGTGTAFAFANEAPEGGTYFITNYHVIDRNWESGQKQITLEQQNRRFTGQIVKVDVAADLALLQSTDKFPRLASATDPAKPGQPVVVVGSPLGLEDSVTSGVVSALRNIGGQSVLQFDAPVNPGNSGGPIVNAQGQVVGVVNAKLNNAEGISLGIPVAVACQTFSLC
jgi:S1-C subfamily serine protease